MKKQKITPPAPVLSVAQVHDAASGNTKEVQISGTKFKVYIHPPVKKSAIRSRRRFEKDEKGKIIREWREDVEETWIAGNFVELIPIGSGIGHVAYSDMARNSETYEGECETFRSAVEAAKQIASELKMRTDYASE